MRSGNPSVNNTAWQGTIVSISISMCMFKDQIHRQEEPRYKQMPLESLVDSKGTWLKQQLNEPT
jgi:hypothetical protein